jgi:hypothetical protein
LEFGLKLPLVNLSLVIMFGAEFFLQRREAIQKQLAHVSDGNRIAALNAFAGELDDEVAEKLINGSGGGEVIERAEKLGGEGFGIGLRDDVMCEMVLAERIVIGSDEHAATTAAGVDVIALIGS